MKTFAELDIENNGQYIKLLSAVAKLSGLFSENTIPYINYRAAEKIFCKSFNANDLSRSDTAYDASYKSIGVGLKTFNCPTNSSTEKVAEFNSLSGELRDFRGKKLACKLAQYRNERIDLANRLYKIKSSLYHIVARKDNELVLFETDYDKIDLNNIKSVNSTSSSLQFEDGKNLYRYNYSKSTLFRKFYIPDGAHHIPIDIIENPFSLLLELFENNDLKPAKDKLKKGINYVILPLYGTKKKQKFVFEKSGLNQWNAGGRKRTYGEVEIRIPKQIHNQFPGFFPERDKPFGLKTPTGEKLQAKVCQDDSKALMTNPNKALSDWLLRKIFQAEEKEVLTIEKMNKLGFDSVRIEKTDNSNYKIDISPINSYEKFINQ